ncbi:MAG TPA: methyltransferase domain-containing protein [Dokdonella sp.]|nr:methyltransferase domain-containing protein [Dokdonella sp.]
MQEEAALRARAKELASVPWHHSIRLFPDLLIKGNKSEALLAAERAAILDPLALDGRSVLDIGSWNGYFAFEAKRAGAARVIASDSLCWNLPVFRGRETFDLARACLGLDIETKVIDPTELPGDLAPADVVLFLGVFYHMHDPIAVLKAAAGIARDALVIETHQDLLDVARPAMAFYPRDTLNGDHSNWWGPNPQCMFELLESIGWMQVYYQPHPVVGAGRGVYHAFRSADAAARLLRRRDGLLDLRTPAGQAAAFAVPAFQPGPRKRWLGF